MTENHGTIHVECYAGYRGEESPRRFAMGGNTIEVVEILDRWLSPDHRYFKVEGDDQSVYLLRHDVHTETWEIVQRHNLP
jgi:hypothetical protein